MSARHHDAFDRRALLRGALSVGAGAVGSESLSGCYKPCPPFGQWNNAVGTESARPALLMFPTSAGELVGIVQQAEAGKRRVRMTGSGHSFSDIAITDDYLLLPSRLDVEPREKPLQPGQRIAHFPQQDLMIRRQYTGQHASF